MHSDPEQAPFDESTVDEALNALDAEGLRTLIRELLTWTDESTRVRFESSLLSLAARGPSRWTPKGPSPRVVQDVQRFVESGMRFGWVEPRAVDSYLIQASKAFHARDHRTAIEIFRGLLTPLAEAELHAGQDELLDEVLAVDLTECVAQFAVSMYLLSTPEKRAEAVMSAFDEMAGIAILYEPLREMEQAAVEPLPELESFLQQWQSLLEKPIELRHSWRGTGQWLREVVGRLEGTGGLARIARASRDSSDLHAWCRSPVDAGDWNSALAAYEEAEKILGEGRSRGQFLDGAALAAQELRRGDLPRRLEEAWRKAPSLVRLQRWLGSSKNRAQIRERIAEALDACLKQSHCQRALLLFLAEDFESAAQLLASATGLGWSEQEHPGHLAFALFTSSLSAEPFVEHPRRAFDELERLGEPDGPRLETPEISDLITLARPQSPEDDATRQIVLQAMRKAAEKRLTGVTENQRRKYYAHAASLAATCARVDGSAGGKRWLENVRQRYRRFPALQREFRAQG
ncbi:MAG: hypothetical protein RL885_06915 [Planctomycetota bacterium]